MSRVRTATAIITTATIVVASVLAGCAQTVTVKVPSAHTRVVVDGHDLGKVPDGGATMEVRPGMGPLPYAIERSERGGHAPASVGAVARTEPLWWMVAAGVTGALCCAPTLAGAGFCLANPAVLGAPLGFALSGDVGALTASCVAPSWFTLPLVTSCGAIGLAPLGLALLAETVPAEITLPAAAAPRGETAMAH